MAIRDWISKRARLYAAIDGRNGLYFDSGISARFDSGRNIFWARRAGQAIDYLVSDNAITLVDLGSKTIMETCGTVARNDLCRIDSVGRQELRNISSFHHY